MAPPEHSGSLRGLSNKASTPGTCRTILVDGKSAISIASRSDKLSASGEAVELLYGDVMVELGKRMEVAEASGFCYCSAGG